jgi:hypothetical protein
MRGVQTSILLSAPNPIDLRGAARQWPVASKQRCGEFGAQPPKLEQSFVLLDKDVIDKDAMAVRPQWCESPLALFLDSSYLVALTGSKSGRVVGLG